MTLNEFKGTAEYSHLWDRVREGSEGAAQLLADRYRDCGHHDPEWARRELVELARVEGGRPRE